MICNNQTNHTLQHVSSCASCTKSCPTSRALRCFFNSLKCGLYLCVFSAFFLVLFVITIGKEECTQRGTLHDPSRAQEESGGRLQGGGDASRGVYGASADDYLSEHGHRNRYRCTRDCTNCDSARVQETTTNDKGENLFFLI